MKLRDLRSWHKFVYGLVYPAVLGSMLYDILHVTSNWGSLQSVELSIIVMYCIDFLHLASDLGTDSFPKGTWRDTVFDALIALTFGIAYWQISDRHLGAGYILLFIITLLFVLYNSVPSRRSTIHVTWLALLSSAYGVLSLVAWRGLTVVWIDGCIAWLPVIWYSLYVFWIANVSRVP